MALLVHAPAELKGLTAELTDDLATEAAGRLLQTAILTAPTDLEQMWQWFDGVLSVYRFLFCTLGASTASPSAGWSSDGFDAVGSFAAAAWQVMLHGALLILGCRKRSEDNAASLKQLSGPAREKNVQDTHPLIESFACSPQPPLEP
eukprot:CAMPEP_0198733180 /NCGR_PEP_ID=MMETSP1475-20131203/43501_1 /TAXON_ID= ORGANISM="Unidentified sp., Strain CCMP1999" /NCGR_SAMPLE_ID=MMETSP1475 /ASSEMBLY_ACC=CAM_ASM_001111 /LENGTH=146 /DNA_ID=CAMNT_0044496435 /DNA_START=190 /DNA_END=630 /DNA_ORIENTATION=+